MRSSTSKTIYPNIVELRVKKGTTENTEVAQRARRIIKKLGALRAFFASFVVFFREPHKPRSRRAICCAHCVKQFIWLKSGVMIFYIPLPE